MQRTFTFLLNALFLLLIPFAVMAAANKLRRYPDRQPMADRLAAVRFEPVSVPGVAGAWEVKVDDPRWGGVSSLALGIGRLLALTDAGAIVSLPRPGEGRTAFLRDLPDGPLSPWYKHNRDGEALTRDPLGRGWWVALEFRHSLWLFDRTLTDTLRSVRFPSHRWSANSGVEAMLPSGGALLLIPEGGTEVLEMEEGAIRRRPLTGATGGIAEAARLPDGRALLLVREVGLRGFTNRLAWLERSAGGYRAVPFATLPVGPLDNVEGAAAEALPGGGTRLWLATDNDFSPRRRTLLVALDLPARAGD